MEDIGKSGPAGYATLARFRLAAADRGPEAGEAAAAFEAIAKESGLDPLLADYARLQAAMLRLDSASWTEMQNRLNDLVAESNPWRFSARELLGLAAQKAGKTEEARTQFQRLLSDRNTPPSIGERARIMLAMLTEAELASTRAAGHGSQRRREGETARLRHRNKTKGDWRQAGQGGNDGRGLGAAALSCAS